MSRVFDYQITNLKIRSILSAGISAKAHDPRSDLTPLSYHLVGKYITLLEQSIISSGNKLPQIL